MKLKRINLRDPFIVKENSTYYLYGTYGKTAFIGRSKRLFVYESKDLVNFTKKKTVFIREKDFFSTKWYWAPEVHLYNSKYYMFVTFASKEGGLGTSSLVSSSLEGPFIPLSNGYITPHDYRALDGTLYISKDNIPYLVFCHEWRQIKDGTIECVRLSSDLKEAISEPKVIFKASEAPFKKAYIKDSYVTDGPFLIRTDDNKLHLLWSTFSKDGYVVALAHSSNDEIDGKWTIDPLPLYKDNGGHAMIFKDNNGYKLVLHTPNIPFFEHPKIIDIEYINGSFRLINN